MINKLKYILLMLGILTFAACGKESDSAKDADRSGSYKGNISTYANGTLSQTINNHTLVLMKTGTAGQVSITNNVIITTSAKISGNTLTIPKTVAVSSPYGSVTEYGTGTFSGNTLTIEFHQDNVASNGTITVGAKWTGVLTKQ